MKKIILVLIVFFTMISVGYSADRYWVNGTGNWDASTTTHWSSSSGGAGGSSVPTSSDNVYFDNASNPTAYTVTITATATTLNLNLSNPASGSVTWAGSSALNVYGSLYLQTGITRSYSGGINFLSTSNNTKITTSNITLGSNIVFNSIGGWEIMDTIIATSGTVTINAGNLNLNNNPLNLNILTMGGGTIINSSNITAATINYNNNINFIGNNINFIAKTKNSQIIIATNLDFENLNVTFTGVNNTNAFLIKSSILGTTRYLNITTLNANNVEFQDINLNQSVNLSSFIVGDCGGNTNITFTPAQNNYWIGGTGSWSSVSEWANSSNGTTSTGRVSLCQDTAIFDANSFSGAGLTVTQDMPRIGSVNWTGVTNTPTFTTSTTASVFGNLILSSAMTLTASTQTYTFEGRGNYYIDSAGKTWAKTITINNINGSYTLLSNFIHQTTNNFVITSGTFDANDFNFTGGTLNMASASIGRILYMGDGIWNLGKTDGTSWDVISTGTTLYAENSTLKFTGINTNANPGMNGGNLIYNIVWIATTGSFSTKIADSNTINTLIIDINRTLTFTAGTTQTIANWSASGNSSSYVTIKSTSTTNANLVYSGTTRVSADYLNISDITVSPSNTWYAGTHSINASDTNWIFTVPQYITFTLLNAINNTYIRMPYTFTFNVTEIAGTYNLSLWLNNSVNYGSNNSINATGVYDIIATAMTTGEWLYKINASNGQTSEQRNIYVVGTTTCIVNLGNAYYRPNDCTDTP